MDLKDRTIVLTGAARIGVAVAEALLTAGANLVISYRQNLPEIKSDKVLMVKAELSDENEVRKLIAEAKNRFGPIHGLVHMAANYERVPWKDLDLAAWDRSMDAIAKSAFLTAKLVGNELLLNDGDVKGKMIFISDWSVLSRPYKDYLAYNAAKSAVEGLTKSLAKELAPHVAVNAVAPGPMIRPPDLSDEDNEEVMSNTPLRRWGGGEEIAKAVMYFLDSDFITGQVLPVDGGRSIA